MSALGDHLGAGGVTALPNVFYRVRPQILRKVLQTLNEAVVETVNRVGAVRLIEPQFSRQLASCFEDARDASGVLNYDISHQAELPICNSEGSVVGHRRLDIRILFRGQIGRRGDYLGIECKYLDAGDRHTDAEYVEEGVDRIVTGAYALGHDFAIMVGLERVGPLSVAISHVDSRLRRRYGITQGLQLAPHWGIAAMRESRHPQNGGPHNITLIHGFWPITAEVAEVGSGSHFR